MGRGKVDLDLSLDDIIKHSKKRPSNDKRLSTQSSKGGHGGRPNVNARVSKPNSNNSKDRGNATTINRRIGASTTDRNSSSRINSRLTRGSASRPPRADIKLKRNSHGSISVKVRETIAMLSQITCTDVCLRFREVRALDLFHQYPRSEVLI